MNPHFKLASLIATSLTPWVQLEQNSSSISNFNSTTKEQHQNAASVKSGRARSMTTN